MRHLHAALLALCLCLTTTDCGLQLPSVLTAISTVVSEASIYLGKFVQVVNAVFAAAPDAALQKTIDEDVANTQAALAALDVAARGAADGTVTLAELSAVYEAFKKAWDKMLGDAAPTGAVSTGERFAARPGMLVIPPGEHFRPKGL